jgi:uncharacterized membrane protein YdjX (TVP38/TMEM64 family)
MSKDTRKFLTMVAILAACILVFFLTPLRSAFSRERVELWSAWVQGLGIVAPMLFLAILVVTAVIGVPRMYPTLLIGALYSIPIALLVSIVGSTVGAAAAFLFARHMGRDFVERRFGSRFRRLFTILRDHGFSFVVLLRVVPFSNFVVTNYVCGVSSIRFPDYLIATVLGMIPSTVMFVLLGRGLGRHDVHLVVAATVVFILFTSLAIVYYRRVITRTADCGAGEGPRADP